MLIMSLSNSSTFHFVRWQAETVRRNRSNEDYIIWDIGLEKEQKKELQDIATVLDFEDIAEEYNKNIAPLDNKVFRQAGGRSVVSRPSLRKPFCLKACVAMGHDEILYLDADAFLNRKIDDIFKNNFNVAVTLRKVRPAPIPPIDEPRRFRFKLLNAGVQLFKNEGNKLDIFFDEFIHNYIFKNPQHSDQGNLNHIIDKCKDFNWTEINTMKTLKIKGTKLKVLILDCSVYNKFVNNRGLTPFPVVCHAKGAKKRSFALDSWQKVEGWIKGTYTNRK